MKDDLAPLVQLQDVSKVFHTDEVETHALDQVSLAIHPGEYIAILLADEPTGNLDSKNGEAVMGLLRTLHDEGSTICMVTHDPRYAEHAQREIHLFDGRMGA